MRIYAIWFCLLVPLIVLADSNEGERLYLESGGYGCGVCHGIVADGGGQAGGYIRGASLDALNSSLLTNAPMQPLGPTLSETDRQNLVDYLQALAAKTLVSLAFENDQWSGTFEPWQSGNAGDLVLYNATFEMVTVDLTLVGGEKVSIEPLATLHWQWTIKNLPDDLSIFDLTPTTLKLAVKQP